ncbi:MAG: hypothetical protein WBM28_02510 [Burkholderiales bacterium]
MDRLRRYAGQVVLYALFAAIIGYFSTSPRYRHLQPGEGLLRLSFSHPGKIRADCRQRTPEELAKLPANMRTPLDCPRERSPVIVRVELDGAELVHEAFAPSGLSRDGASTGYRRLPIAAGRHQVRVQFNDDVRVKGFDFEAEKVIDVAAGQVVLIDLAPERGGVVIR